MSLPLDQIICGDNCDVLGTLPRGCIDLVVTSPPYDDLRTYGGHSWDFYGVAWQLKRVLKPGGVIVWVVADATKDGSETGTSFEQALHFKRLGLNLHDTMLYAKSNPVPMNHPRYEQEFEYAFILSCGRPRVANILRENCRYAGGSTGKTHRRGGHGNGDKLVMMHGAGGAIAETKQRGNIWHYMVGGEETASHCAVFPEALARDHILSWSNEGDIVLDPFNGSGTTTKMARELGRHYIGIEVNPEYVAIAKKRLQQQVMFGVTSGEATA